MPFRRYILAGLCGSFLVLFLIVPILQVIWGGFFDHGRPSTYWLAQVWADHALRQGLINALGLACATTIGVLVLAIPLALLAHQFDFRGKSLASAMLMVPMILPPFVGALAIQKLLAADGGSINLILESLHLGKIDFLGGGFWAVVLMETLHLYPIMYLNAAGALANIDPTLTEAARNLGASRWRVLRSVILPLIGPGLFAGGTLVFIWSFTEIGTPAMFKYNQVTPVQIFLSLNKMDITPKTYAMVFLMLSSSVALYGLAKFLFGRSVAGSAGKGVAATARRPGALGTTLIWLAFGAVTLVAVLPHVGVVLMSFAGQWGTTILPERYTLAHVQAVFTDQATWNSIVNSLHYASLATAVDVVLGLLIAYLVVRLKVKGAAVLDGLAMLPLAVPGLVIAGGYVLLTADPPRVPYLADFLKSLNPARDPTIILIIAYSVRRLPYMVRSISAGLEQVSPTLEEAARNLGATPVTAVLRVTVPLIAANILAGAILTFSFSMLEVSDSLILAQREMHYPITKQIWELASGTGSRMYVACALGMFGMFLLTGTLVAANFLLGRRMGALFRV